MCLLITHNSLTRIPLAHVFTFSRVFDVIIRADQHRAWLVYPFERR